MADKRRDKADGDGRTNGNGREHPIKEPPKEPGEGGLVIDVELPPSERKE
jgi:hypothetical protein